MNIQDWFPLGWTGWISLQSKGLSKSFLQHHSQKASILWRSAFFTVQLSHPYKTTGKTIALTRWTFVGKVMSPLFNMLPRLVVNFSSKEQASFNSWLQSPPAVILEPRKIKSDTVSTVSPSICHEMMGPDAMILVFWMLSFKPTFSLSSFTFIKRLFTSSLSAIRVVSSAYLRLLIFLLAILISACDAGKDWGQEEKGVTEDEMIGWQHPHNGNGLEKTLGDREEQEIVVCCGSWGCKELDMT